MRKHLLILTVSMLVFFSSTKVSFTQAPGLATASFTFRGDINEDSRVNIFDLLAMLKMLADPEVQLTRTRQIADMDVSGAVNIFDLLGLLKVLSGAEEPGIIYWGPSIARIIPSMVVVGDTINIETENFDEGTTAADVKAYIDTNEVNLLEFTLENIKIIIPEWFTGGELTLTVGTDTTNSVYLCQGITLVSIPADSFQMGSESGFNDEKPIHNVSVSDFQMSAFEITNAQYAYYLNSALAAEEITATSSSTKGATGDYIGQEYLKLDYTDCRIAYNGSIFVVFSGYDNRPVVEVTWFGARAFALRYGFDLPREAEWEYACRGGKQYEYGTNDGMISSENANYDWNTGRTTDVGSYPANPFGLYDMSGNVEEWCSDWYDRNYYEDSPIQDPTGPESGSQRVKRGGGWSSLVRQCMSASRGYSWPSSSSDRSGFRVVRRP